MGGKMNWERVNQSKKISEQGRKGFYLEELPLGISQTKTEKVPTKSKQHKSSKIPTNRVIKEETVKRINFTNAVKKHYGNMLKAENQKKQVENAILTLQFADHLLRAELKEQIQFEWNTVFSALTKALHMKQGGIHKIGPLLSVLFFHQEASIKESDSKMKPKISGIDIEVKSILAAAGFDVP